MDPVDAGEHLRILSRVVGQMHFENYEVDEAWSEGLVAITEAAQTYDPQKGPLAHWLARNIRWSLQTWRNSQRYTLYLPPALEHPKEDAESRVQLNEFLRLMRENLTPREEKIVRLIAMGYNGKEIAGKLGIQEMAVSRAKRTAIAKLSRLMK